MEIERDVGKRRKGEENSTEGNKKG